MVSAALPPAERPRARERQVVLRVEHERAARVPLLDDDEHIVEDERRGVGHVGIHGHGGEQQPGHGKQRAKEPVQPDAPEQRPKLRVHGHAGERLDRDEHERDKDVAEHNAAHERQRARERAGELLAEDIARDAGAGEVRLQIAALHVVHECAGIRDGREQRGGKEHRAARERTEGHRPMLEQHRGGRLRLEQQQHLRKRAEEHAQHAPKHGKQERPPERPLQIAFQFPHRIPLPSFAVTCPAALLLAKREFLRRYLAVPQ